MPSAECIRNVKYEALRSQVFLTVELTVSHTSEGRYGHAFSNSTVMVNGLLDMFVSVNTITAGIRVSYLLSVKAN